MDSKILSSKYYKLGTKKEPCIPSKIMKVAVIILVLSGVLTLFSSLLLEMSLNLGVLIALIIFAVVFAFSLVFSFILIFLSKKHSSIIILRFVCYLILLAMVVVLSIGVLKIFNKVITLYINSNGVLDEEKLLKILQPVTGYFTVATILEIAFNISMLISFKIKKLSDSAVAKTFLVLYILTIIADILIFAFSLTTLSFISEISSVLWAVCLYFILEDRTVDVACMIYIDKDGEELVDEEQNQLDIKENIKIKRNVFEDLKVAGLVSLGTLGTIITVSVGILGIIGAFCLFKFDVRTWAWFIIASVAVLFFSVLAFCILDSTGRKWLDILCSFSISVGLILILCIAKIYPNYDEITAYILSTVIVSILTFGVVTYFFFYNGSKELSLKFRLPVFIIISLFIIYCILSIFFSDMISIQSHSMFPPLFVCMAIGLTVTGALKYMFKYKS